MKTPATLVVAGLAALGFAGPVAALTPTDTSFHAIGPATISGFGATVSCTMTIRGNTGANTNSVASIYHAVFSGGAGCADVHAVGLPWNVANDGAFGIVYDMAVSIPGVCGPVNVAMTIHPDGHWRFNDAALRPCRLTVDLHTYPHITPP